MGTFRKSLSVKFRCVLVFVGFVIYSNSAISANGESDAVVNAKEVINEVLWEYADSQLGNIVATYIESSHQANLMAQEMLMHANNIEKGAVSTSIKATSQELRLAASKWMRASAELKDAAEELKKTPKKNAARGAKWLSRGLEAVQICYDVYQLYKGSKEFSSKYPAFDLAASPAEYFRTARNGIANVALSKYLTYIATRLAPKVSGGAIVIGLSIAVKPIDTRIDMYYLMPSDRGQLRDWVEVMDVDSRAFFANGIPNSLKNGTATGLDVPNGLIQYLQVIDKMSPDPNMSWVHNWSFKKDANNEIVKLWRGNLVQPFDLGKVPFKISLSQSNITTWDGISSNTVTAMVGAAPNSGVIIQVLPPNGNGRLVSMPITMIKRSNNNFGDNTYTADLADNAPIKQLANGNYSLRAVVLNMQGGEGANSALVPLSILRSGGSTPKVELLTGNPSLNENSVITLIACTENAGASQPSANIVDSNGKLVLRSAFNLKLLNENGKQNWQYQAPVGVKAGSYSMFASIRAQDGRVIESNKVPLNVTGVSVPPPAQPMMQGVSPQNQPMVNQPLTLIFNGHNLTPDVRVTLQNCVNTRESAPLNANQIRLDCVPQTAGAQSAGWKPNISVRDPIYLSQKINVLPAQVSLPTCPNGNGNYCGDGLNNRSPQHLFACVNGQYNIAQQCKLGCDKAGAGKNDACKADAPPPPKIDITGVSANPNSVQVGQTITFVANLNTAQGVSKVELVFPEVGVVEPMQQTGATQWSRINRSMSQVGANRPYQIVVTTSTGQTVQSAIGSYTVNNAPPPPPKIDITGVSANPNSVQVGQQMNFVANLSSAQGVTKVDLIFPDAGDLTEPMIQSGATQWSKTRTMQATAANRQFKVRATLANGTAIIQAGTFTVTAPPVAPPPPSQPAVSITGISANPNSVQVGQQMNFVANLNTAQGVSKVDLIFPDAGDLTEPMIQSGATKWSKTRTMQAAAANRQFKVRATLANGTAIIQAGTFAVTAPPVAPPPPSQPAVSITGISANPNSVQVGQQMNFVANLNTAQGVSKIELVFPEVGVVEPMQQTGATQWSRINRPMSQAGANRPYQIVVTTSTGQTVQSAIGSYTVNNAPPPSQPPASTSPVQPPPSSLPQLSIGNISVSTSGNPDVSFSTNRPIVSTDVSVDGKDRNLINYSCTTGTQVSCKINRWPISRGNFGISIQVRDANGMSANAKAGFSR